jgi:hypothetical protein
MNENNSTTEQSCETKEFRLPQKSLKEKIKFAYGYNFKGSVLYMIAIILLCNQFFIMMSFLLEQLRYTLTHISTLTTIVLSPIEPKIMIISEILLLVFFPTVLFDQCIRENDRIDRNFEKHVNNLKKQHQNEQEEINNVSDKGEESE